MGEEQPRVGRQLWQRLRVLGNVRVVHSLETEPTQDPTVGLCLGLCGGP